MAQWSRVGECPRLALLRRVSDGTQMKLLKTRHRDAFNAAPDVDWPGIGWVRTVGAGAGDYAFVSIDDAGHCESIRSRRSKCNSRFLWVCILSEQLLNGTVRRHTGKF